MQVTVIVFNKPQRGLEGWKLGDQLSFTVEGQAISAPITSIRKVNWDSMRPNFFIIGAPELLANSPAQFITSFHVPEPNVAQQKALLQQFPTLTLFDLGRIPMSIRMGFDKVAKTKGWGITVAGNSTRYRRRVTVFQKLTQVCRIVGWDARFVYLEQSFWRGDDCTCHMLLRSAFISKGGIVPPAEVLAALGQAQDSPDLPAWIKSWIESDAERPWPPLRG